MKNKIDCDDHKMRHKVDVIRCDNRIRFGCVIHSNEHSESISRRS